MKTFAVSSATKKLNLSIAFALLAFIGCFFYLQGVYGFEQSRYLVFSIYVWALCTLGALYYACAAYVARQTRLVLDEDGLQLQTMDRWGFFYPKALVKGKNRYDQITNVKLMPLVGRIVISNILGQKITLDVSDFGDAWGEDVVVLLQQRLLASPFPADPGFTSLASGWKRWHIPARLILGPLRYSMWIFLFLYQISQPHPLFSTSWNMHPSMNRSLDVQTYTLAGPSDLWILSNQYDLPPGKIYHLKQGQVTEWAIPDLNFEYKRMVSLGWDRENQPIVWFYYGAAHYRQGKWNYVPFSFSEYATNDIVTVGERGWMIVSGEQKETPRLFSLGAISGAVQEIPLPSSALQAHLEPSSLRVAPNGTILVAMENDQAARIYLLTQENHWQAQEYPVNRDESFWLHSFFLDSHDAMWVLWGDSKNDQISVQKIMPDGSFANSRLPVKKEESGFIPGFYDSLLIDQHQRVWVTTFADPAIMAVFEPIWNGDAIEVVHYSPENSNYAGHNGFNHPALDSNGIIWSLETGVSTLDSNLSDLPAPIPDWLGAWNIWLFVFAPAFVIVALLVYLVRLQRPIFISLHEHEAKG